LEQAAILSDLKPEVAVDGVKIYYPGLRRGITTLERPLQNKSFKMPTQGELPFDD
jgi:IS5 family transposase